MLGAKLERPGLLSFVLHSIFEERRQVTQGVVTPQEGLTKDDFRHLVEYFLESGYEFVSSEQVLGGLSPEARYALITFDDGYANNLAAVDVLDAFDVPAIIFVTTDRVETNRCFWWDVVHRERHKRGSADAEISREVRWLKTQPYDSIDPYLESVFGEDALHPVGDLDRPLSREELRALVRNPRIEIGNHTKSHAILTNLEPDEVRTQFEDAQDFFDDAIGRRPDAIAYPNGDYDANVLEIARTSGFRIGVTADQRKNRVAAPGTDLLALGRYVIERDVDLIEQLRVTRSELQLSNTARRLLRPRNAKP